MDRRTTLSVKDPCVSKPYPKDEHKKRTHLVLLLSLLVNTLPKGRPPNGLPTLDSKGDITLDPTLDGATLRKGSSWTRV